MISLFVVSRHPGKHHGKLATDNNHHQRSSFAGKCIFLSSKISKMKKTLIVAAMLFVLSFVVGNTAQAQSEQPLNVGQMVRGLVNVNIGAVAANIGDITVADLVDVGDVLSDNRDVDILSNILNNSPILSNNSDVVTNLLRDADILTDTQVIVGVLSTGLFVVQDIP